MVVGSFLCLLQQAFYGDEMDNFFAQKICHDSFTHQSKQRRFYAIQGVYGFETITQEVGARDFLQAWELEIFQPIFVLLGKREREIDVCAWEPEFC